MYLIEWVVVRRSIYYNVFIDEQIMTNTVAIQILQYVTG